MPGRLIMDEQSNGAGSEGLKRSRSEAHGTGGQQIHAEVRKLESQSGEAARHEQAALTNGAVPVNGEVRLPNGDASKKREDGDAPALDQSWREDQANVSLGKMMERLAQFCYSDLNGLIDELAEQPVSQSSGHANGTISIEDIDEVSVAKKRKIMEFAREQRDRFIRALVISDFSRNADDVANVIDVNLHLRKNDFAVAESVRSIGQLKIDMAQAKRPNPNIELAMEVLSTGKTQSVPDFGYLPAPKLTAKDLLRTLREMNVMLATRLSLHEDIPEPFMSYSIVNGRATFVVPTEFEVDLAVIDEDLTSAFFFIDIRFLFTPSTETMDAGLREHFEIEVNRALRDKGLQGCYETLHNFVLTHKINILQQQASELFRGRWFDTIKVDRMRRNLVVQYWTGRPGKKSWLEFGVASGTVKGGVRRKAASPYVVVRWFRVGVEVEQPKLDIDWQNLCLEDTLLQVTTRHAMASLTTAQEGLRALATGGTMISASLSDAQNREHERCLMLRIPSLRKDIIVSILPIDGKYSVAPLSAATTHAQRRLNEDPTIDVPRRLVSTLCAISMESVQREAETLKWSRVTDLARQNNLNLPVGADCWQWRAYAPTKFWGQDWIIVLTVGNTGLRWWTARLQTANEGKGRIISMVDQLSLADPADTVPSRRMLIQVEKQAVAQVSFTALSQQLQAMHIPYRFGRSKLISSDPTSAKAAVYIQFSKLVRDPREKKWKPWALEPVRVTHHGVEKRSPGDKSEGMCCRHDARLTLHVGVFKRLQKHLSKSRDRSIAISASGGLALRLLMPFGTPFIDQLQSRLASIYRLDQYVDTLNRAQVRCDKVSLSELSFTYNLSAPYSAHLSFSPDQAQRTTLRFTPADSNPHVRVRVLLENQLNAARGQGFLQFVSVLLLTLPLLTAAPSISQTLLLQPRSASWYSLKALSPIPALTFILRIRARNSPEGKSELKWHIEQDRTKASPESLPVELQTRLRELWNSKSEHFTGLGNGLATDARGIAHVIERIENVVRGGAEVRTAPTDNAPVKQERKPSIIDID